MFRYCYLVNLILFSTFLLNVSCNDSRRAVFGGYAPGSLVDSHLKVYEDSTYELNNIETTIGIWKINNDTLNLWKGNTICAQIVGTDLVSYECPEFRILILMEFERFIPPKVIVFPN